MMLGKIVLDHIQASAALTKTGNQYRWPMCTLNSAIHNCITFLRYTTTSHPSTIHPPPPPPPPRHTFSDTPLRYTPTTRSHNTLPYPTNISRHLSNYLNIYLSTYLTIYLSIYLTIYLSHRDSTEQKSSEDH